MALEECNLTRIKERESSYFTIEEKKKKETGK